MSRHKLIEFSCSSGYVGLPEPQPAARHVPDWFKKVPPTYRDDAQFARQGNEQPTVKQCLPFLDAMTAGYIIPLWVDLVLQRQGNEVRFSWRDVGPGTSTPVQPQHNWEYDGEARQLFKLLNPWAIRTPPGYSCLFLAPLNRAHPLETFAGLVDTDTYHLPVNFTFTVPNNDWTGVIPRGEPVVQVIPLRRELFQGNAGGDTILGSLVQACKNKVAGVFVGGYRDNFWVPKRWQ